MNNGDGRDELNQFAELLAVSGRALCEFDEDLRFSFVSDNFPAGIVVDQQGIVGQTPDELGWTLGEDGLSWSDVRSFCRAQTQLVALDIRTDKNTGPLRTLRLNASPLRCKDNDFSGYRGIVETIAEPGARDLPAARSDVETILSDAIQSLPQGVILYDAERRMILANASYRKIFPQLEELLVPGTKLESIIAGAATRIKFKNFTKYVSKRMAYEQDADENVKFHVFDNGSLFMNAVQFTSTGGTVSVWTDVSEMRTHEDELRLAKDEAETANRSKSTFLANMSHELRTPLNAVIGFSEVIVKEVFGSLNSERYRQYAADIHSSGEHLLQIINDILDLSKIEAGAQELELEDLALAEVIDESIQIVRDRASQADVELHVATAQSALHLKADRLRIKQILLNLLTNAIKFSAPGTRIDISMIDDAAKGVGFRVQDQGCGIEAKDIASVLEPFGQASNPVARREEGTGLGLPLSKSLAELHGGALELTSEIGIGTNVTVMFPPQDRISPYDGGP